jgi:hypothetical protein
MENLFECFSAPKYYIRQECVDYQYCHLAAMPHDDIRSDRKWYIRNQRHKVPAGTYF